MATSAEPPPPPDEAQGEPATPATPPQRPPDPTESPTLPAGPRRRRVWPRALAACTALLVLAGAGTAWYMYRHLDGNIRTDTATAQELQLEQSQRPSAPPAGVENILLIGTDNRGGGNGKYGQDTGTQRSDTVILLHLAADRHSATAMSIPRDLMVQIPKCRRPDGSHTRAQHAQFNWAFEFGGAACTIRTVEELTGIRVDHHLIVDFTGFKKMVDAVGGVEVCVPHAVHDKDAHLDLPAGRQVLHGEQALGYVRARHGIGDGSDTQRIERQQGFLASLVKKIRSNGVLLNPVRLYPLLDAATSSLTADAGLDSLSELYDLARSLQKTPTSEVRFLTVPRQPYIYDANRDQLKQPAAGRLFGTLRKDGNVTVEPTGATAGAGAKASASPSPEKSGGTPGPAYRGTTADRDICGQA
ncbi:LCP family protein [Actinacidiphila oryziradicis]|uniref:LCP family glycopolymer transferase n=1 Tax=Actinacidiphila oryziradicis TaxID=2571141 RepID=UPI0023F4716F|nr:LCP family protein [Actinacidiphila oryziradicis]MCW2873944.1 cell envelope-related transcriptional attenuator [Actinacidiphila oryziradicis]